MKLTWIFAFFLAAQAFGAIEGVVLNGTTGQPQPDVSVALVHPSADKGMQTLGSAKSDAEGKFKIDQELPSPPALLQGSYQGVTYNLFLQPGAPTTGLHLPVYQATAQSSTVKLAQHMVMIEPGADALHVTEVFQFENGGKTTFLDPAKGSIQFFVPKDAKTATVNIEAPGGMPIQRSPEKTPQAGVYKESYPVKPGDATTYEVTYALPASTKLAGKVFGDAPVRLVTGPSVTLNGGSDLKSLGQEPKLRAHIYEVPSNTAGAAFEVSIEGTGAIRTEAADTAQQQQEDAGQPEPTAGNARVYDRLYWVLGLAFGILALGGTLLYRRGTA